jgi:ferredoxin-NADP reductase/ferredoxin
MLKLKSVNFDQQQFQVHHLDQSYAGQQEWAIGRNTTCDVVLPSPEVSRVHGQIVFSENSYHFVDIGSTSGSLLNGEIVPSNQQRVLRLGDLLQIGQTFLYIEELSPPTPVLFVPSLVSCDTLPLLGRQWTEGDLMCRCCRIVDETPDVKTFCFVADPPVLFSYLPGQFVTVEVEIDGRSVTRPYSISSTPSRPWNLSLTVKRLSSPTGRSDVPPGLVSNWLHEHLKVGDRLKLRGGPLGQFTCLPNLPPKLLLISAGSGITPMMSMSRWIQDTVANSDVIFLHTARTPEDIIFRLELEAMAAQMPNFHLAITLTDQSSGRSWMGLNGRVSPSILHMVAPDLIERFVYVCGSREFMQSIKTMLKNLTFPMQNYKEESFGDYKADRSETKNNSEGETRAETRVEKRLEPASNKQATKTRTQAPRPPVNPVVKFVKSGREVPADGKTSILELAEQEGVDIRYACRAGSCGACKTMSRQGKVKYDTPPTALSQADHQAGYVLPCVSYPVEHLMLEA